MVEAVRRPARLVVLLALALLVLGAVLPARADAARPLERRLVRFINVARAEAGRQPVRFHDRLTLAARRHSRRMAAAGHWFHSDGLAEDVLGRVSLSSGENVGRAPSVSTMHRWFMRSPVHRANVLSPLYERVGLGIVFYDGAYWVTEVFVG